MALDLLQGVDIFKTAQETFNTTEVTAEQLKYVMTMEVPSMYLLENHSVKGHRLTFNIPNRDSSKAQSHRPWQVDIINDKHPNKAVMKSRQLGLANVSPFTEQSVSKNLAKRA